MMLPPIESIKQILRDPNEQKLESISFHCGRLINDKSTEDRKKIEVVDQVCQAVFVSKKNANSQVFQEFGNLYRLLSYSVEKGKHKVKCLKKAKHLFSQAVDTNNKKDNKLIDDLESISLQIKDLEIKLENQQKHTLNSRTISKKASALVLKEKEGPPQTAIEMDSNTGSAIENEFNRALNQLEIQTREFREINSSQTQATDIEDTSAIQKGIISLTETSKNLSGLATKILEGQFPESFVTEIWKISNQIITILTTLIKGMDYLSISEDKEIFAESASEVLHKCNLFVKRVSPLEERKCEKHTSSPSSNLTAFNADTCNLLTAVGFNCSKDEIDQGDSIIKVFKNCQTHLNVIIELIRHKTNVKKAYNDHLASAFFAWSSFFQFTERNYLLLDSKKKNILFKVILEAESAFEYMVETSSDITFILETYISILVQKHPFIKDDEKKNIQFRFSRDFLVI